MVPEWLRGQSTLKGRRVTTRCGDREGQVEPWTQVLGHAVIADRPQAFCSCGARVPRDSEGVDRSWRQEHLAEAWPILVPRDGDEPHADWLTRVALQHSAAEQAEDELSRRLGLDRPVEPGQAFPVITPQYAAAGERVEVLEHQMSELRQKLIERRGWEG